MRTLTDLANVLIGCRVVTRARWERAARIGRGDPTMTLDALTNDPPAWFTPSAADTSDIPHGLTDYQRDAIDLWLNGDDTPLERQLAINQFILLEKLGAGGQGDVYRSRQLNPPRFVAVKTLRRDTESDRARFELEARAMMKVQHPGIARFYLYERVRDAANKPTDEYLIAMEFADGTDLHRLIRWSGPVPWSFAVKWAIDLLGGLAIIHQNGFIHRDVKPANVIALGPPPEPGTAPGATAAKLLDFGAVRKVEQRGPTDANRRIFVGTREYAPPEQWEERIYPASDLYALGGTLFYAITGRPPFEIEGRDAIAFMKAHMRAPIPDASEHNLEVPKELSRLLQRMLAKRPDARGSADELLAEFRQLLPSDGSVPMTIAQPVQTVKPSQPASPPLPYRSARTAEVESRGKLDRALDSVLSGLERVFLPDRLRASPGHEPPINERLVALLRRPFVLFLLLAMVVLLVVWAML